MATVCLRKAGNSHSCGIVVRDVPSRPVSCLEFSYDECIGDPPGDGASASLPRRPVKDGDLLLHLTWLQRNPTGDPIDIGALYGAEQQKKPRKMHLTAWWVRGSHSRAGAYTE